MLRVKHGFYYKYSGVSMSFGARLNQYRQHHGWSQTELAQRAGVPQSLISLLESGQRDSVSLDVARRLARALGCGIDYLAGTWEDVAESAPLAEATPAEAAGAPARQRGRPRGSRRPVAAGAARG